MGFHAVQFPTNISYGSRGGPGFKTTILELDSGHEQRIARWSNPRHQYNVRYGIHNFSDLEQVKEFYIARQGAANGFLFRDFLDCTTATTSIAPELGGTAPDWPDEDAVMITGTTWQIVKRYTSGAVTRVRNITKPISNTVEVGINAVEQLSGWTVDASTGIITFGADQTGNTVTAGCEFDVPVRFDQATDAALQAAIQDFGSGDLQDIILTEIFDEGTTSDEFFFGGAFEQSFASNIVVSLANGRMQSLEATAGSLTVALPDPTNIPVGGPIFYLENGGATNAWELEDDQGNTLIASVATGSGAIVLLHLDGGSNKLWKAI